MSSKLAPSITRFLTSKTLLRIKRNLFETRRRLSGNPHTLHYFHQIDDPYSHLVAQLLPVLQSAYNLKFVVHMVMPPPNEYAPERAALENYSRRDAAKIAPFYGLSFTDLGHQPSNTCLQLAQRALAASSNPLIALTEIGEAYWNNDSNLLERMALVSERKASEMLKSGTKMRDLLGHYLGGMLYYGGEWYWGIDRLPYLEDRLIAQRFLNHGCRRVTQFQTRPAFMAQPAKRRLTVEFYPSVRSPYSYVSMPETLDLPNHYPINLVVRPVLPMVMRGLPVPRRKGLYILGDTKREADRIDVPFGKIADPVGEPVERCYSLFAWADEQGKGGAFLLAFCRLAWAQGVDMKTDAGMKKAVEAAELDWQEAQALLGNDDWQGWAEDNRQQMMGSDLWGVPSYRLLDEKGKELFSCWGRDRLWLLAHEIQEALS